MTSSKLINKALIDENADLEFSIKDKVIVGKPLEVEAETGSIGGILLKNLNSFPDHIGQINVQTGEKTTFAEIKERSIRCALWLKKQGISTTDVVCTSTPLQNDDYVPVLASIFIGAIINPWPAEVTPVAADYYFKLIKPTIMFAWEGAIDMLVTAAKNAQVDCRFVVMGKHPNYPSMSDLMAEQDQREIEQFRHFEPKDPKKQLSALLFTSGTTSNSKAVMMSNVNLVKNRFDYMVPRTHVNFLVYSCFSWNTGLHFFTTVIKRQLTRILHLKFDPEATCAVIEKYKVAFTFLTATQLTLLYKADVFSKYDFSKLETILVGGNKPSCSIIEGSRKALPNTQISNTLGMTDAGGRLTVQTKKCRTKNSLGRVVGSVQLKIINPKSGDLLGANQEGELCFKMEALILGYLNNPEETKKVIDDEGWFHTGDLGYYDENGELWITDRLKNIIIYQGVNISPTKIEEILLQHPGVADVAVIPVPHEIDNERPFAFVVKKPGVEVTTEELKELPARYDQIYRLSGGVAFVKEIPYNSNGKKSIKDLNKMVQPYIEK